MNSEKPASKDTDTLSVPAASSPTISEPVCEPSKQEGENVQDEVAKCLQEVKSFPKGSSIPINQGLFGQHLAPQPSFHIEPEEPKEEENTSSPKKSKGTKPLNTSLFGVKTTKDSSS